MPQFIQQCSVAWNTTVSPATCEGTLTLLDISQLTSGMTATDFESLSRAIVTMFIVAYGFKLVRRLSQ